MKTLLTLLIGLLLSFGAIAQTTNTKKVKVKGYTKKDGTYVAPHTRTAPNKTKKDNYSSKPNVNPYTGKKGTKKAKK